MRARVDAFILLRKAERIIIFSFFRLTSFSDERHLPKSRFQEETFESCLQKHNKEQMSHLGSECTLNIFKVH